MMNYSDVISLLKKNGIDTEQAHTIQSDEGYEKRLYDDANGRIITQGVYVNGNPTIGIGHNLSVAPLSDNVIAIMFSEDLQNAIATAHQFALAFWDKLPANARGVLVNMAFNMGQNLFEFHDFQSCLAQNDFDGAAAQMLNSIWARQVGKRATRLAEIMRACKCT